MPKEWGSELPNITKFEKAVPEKHTDLLEKLQALGANWKYVDKCGVVKPLKGIFVDLGAMANACKEVLGKKVGGCTADFYNPLKPLEVDKADALVKAIVAKVEAGQPIVEQDAIALFATIETAS